MISRRTLIGTGLAATLPAAGPALAQNYPRRPIQVIVSANAGGPTDVGARILASIMEKDIGQSVVVVNKPGAGAQLGLTELARSRPDGYTIGIVHMPGTNTIILDPDRKAAFNTDSFIMIINQVLDAGVIWVKADSPYKTLGDLVAAAKQAPGKLSACTTGILSDDHLAILMLQEAADINFRIVHFDGAAQQFTAILGGHVDAAFDNVGSVRKRAQAGEVRVLAVMDKQRSKLMPDYPTTAEQGFPTVVSSSTRGYAAPKGTPPEIVKYLETHLKKAMETPEHMRRMEEVGLEVRIMTGEEYAKYFADQHATAAKYTEWAKKLQQQ
ncbi:MAG: Bug family tripartite tricarboxylate transporter substrate binding protein [Acetobacteraceae bacterium]